MKIFKLRTSDPEHYSLTKSNFELKTNLKAPWYNHDNEKERHFAVCPACNNSTQIIFLYDQTQTLHAKHFLGVAVGEQNKETLKYCPHYSNKPSLNIENKRGDEDAVSLEIKRLLVENFDRVVYLIEKTIGIRLPRYTDKIKRMLETYCNSRGWMYVGANLINIPWIFLYQCRSQNLAGISIRKPEIKEALIQYNKGLTFNDFDQIIYPKGQFLDLNICFLNHKQTTENHELIETITLKITGNNNSPIYTDKINFDHGYFVNLINSTNDEFRDLKLIEVAKKILN